MVTHEGLVYSRTITLENGIPFHARVIGLDYFVTPLEEGNDEHGSSELSDEL
jgi:hypothetical protein